jgi:hypothetical protein
MLGLQCLTALAVIILMAVQTEKADQGGGGVMGLGASGGATTSDIEMEVGIDRIIKPLTRWMCGGFVFASVLAAIPQEKLGILHIVIGVVIYVILMAYGGRVWLMATRR